MKLLMKYGIAAMMFILYFAVMSSILYTLNLPVVYTSWSTGAAYMPGRAEPCRIVFAHSAKAHNCELPEKYINVWIK